MNPGQKTSINILDVSQEMVGVNEICIEDVSLRMLFYLLECFVLFIGGVKVTLIYINIYM